MLQKSCWIQRAYAALTDIPKRDRDLVGYEPGSTHIVYGHVLLKHDLHDVDETLVVRGTKSEFSA